MAATPNPLASLRTFRPAVELSRRLGMDLRVAADVPASPADGVELDDTRLPVRRYFALWDALLEKAGDPMLPVRTAAVVDFGAFSVMGYACLASPTLGEAYDRLSRFNRICTTAWTYSREDRGGEVALRVDFHVPPVAGSAAVAEFLIAEVWHTANAISARPFAPIRVEFTHPEPAHHAELERHFQAPVRFGQPRSALISDPAALALPLRKADPAYLGFFDRQAQALVARFAHEEGVTAQVRQLLSRAYRGEVPGAAEVARALGIGERTLRRRLQKEGTSFGALADGTRKELARRYVAEASVPLAEVAFLLGFSEPSAFHRAFKRWTGQTPAEFRRAAA